MPRLQSGSVESPSGPVIIAFTLPICLGCSGPWAGRSAGDRSRAYRPALSRNRTTPCSGHCRWNESSPSAKSVNFFWDSPFGNLGRMQLGIEVAVVQVEPEIPPISMPLVVTTEVSITPTLQPANSLVRGEVSLVLRFLQVTLEELVQRVGELQLLKLR